mmetsp:Transcript_37293/g.111704  ORF Transcript_37293/g.111704 Transcript_37293/m.111704 type:complete len:223 (-) Transcript_37293:415-1083(-)
MGQEGAIDEGEWNHRTGGQTIEEHESRGTIRKHEGYGVEPEGRSRYSGTMGTGCVRGRFLRVRGRRRGRSDDRPRQDSKGHRRHGDNFKIRISRQSDRRNIRAPTSRPRPIRRPRPSAPNPTASRSRNRGHRDGRSGPVSLRSRFRRMGIVPHRPRLPLLPLLPERRGHGRGRGRGVGIRRGISLRDIAGESDTSLSSLGRERCDRGVVLRRRVQQRGMVSR